MSEFSPENIEKFEALNRLLDEEYILVHIDSTSAELVIPEYLKEQDTVTLKMSRLFKGGIELSQKKIETNLLFNNKYFMCIIPLTAIWGATSSKGSNIIWPGSTPKHILKSIIKGSEKAEEPPSPNSPPKKGHLKRIK